jgi:predicted HAD superfamily Cof-like phosphohydrolase
MQSGNIQAAPSQMILNVCGFNRMALGIEPREIGLLSEAELTYAKKADVEEMDEFEKAHREMDLIGAVDAVLDKIYFSIGFLYRMGLTEQQIEDCFQAVHECNMRKKLGVQEKRGGEGVADAVKPEGWVGPEERIGEILGA